MTSGRGTATPDTVICTVCGRAGKCGSGEVEDIPVFGTLCYKCYTIIEENIQHPTRQEISHAILRLANSRGGQLLQPEGAMYP
jgi:NMD protein affecting ribosome stability and mRNA decay